MSHHDHPHGPNAHHHHTHEHQHDAQPHGPANTSFLQLEISKMLFSEAQQLTREAAQELLREAIKARLRERLGPMLEQLGRLAADEAVDDFETNRKIETLIRARQQASQTLEAKLEEALRAETKK